MATEIEQTGTDARTVRDVTYELLRALGMTTIFGNLGSTEETFLANFPSDSRYVLGLQAASVIAMADGFAQATRSRQHSEWAALDAAFEWGSFIQSQPGYGLGWLAAWAADECTLGQTQRVLNMLNQLETQGLLDSTLTGWPSGSAYVSQLEAFLSAHGYGSAR